MNMLQVDSNFQTSEITDFPPLGKPEELAEKVKNANEVLAGLVDAGKTITRTLKHRKKAENIKGLLNIFIGLGRIVEGFAEFQPKPDDPVVQLIDDLGKSVAALGEKVSTNLAEMKALITEINFFVRILSPAFKLMRYMRDCLHFPGKRANENFLKAYKKYSPLRLTYNLMSYLENDSTNPLKHAMDLEKVKQKATFLKWEEIFDRVLGQFISIEGYARGLRHRESTRTKDQITDACIKIFDQVDRWNEEYAAEAASFWKEVKPWTEDFLKKNSNLSNAQKADAIEEKLYSYFSTDSYYIIVFNASEPQQDHAYYYEENASKVIAIHGVGGSDVLIYESTSGNYKSDEDYDTITDFVNYFTYGQQLIYNKSLDGVIEKQIMHGHMKKVEGCFYALVYLGKKPVIRSANCHGRLEGPGWWRAVKVKDANKRTVYTYYLLVSFGISKDYLD